MFPLGSAIVSGTKIARARPAAIFNARPHTRVTVSLHKHCFSYGMNRKNIAMVCALLLRKRNVKKRKKFWVHPVMSLRLLKRKFYFLYEDLKAQPQKVFRYFRVSSATFDKLLVLLGPSLTFQDTKMRKSVPPEERSAMTLK